MKFCFWLVIKFPYFKLCRRVPVPLEQAVNERIDKMVKQGMGPSKWISPLVVVPRSNSDDIRIFVDMRRANEAVERENHPLPTSDDLLPHLAKAKFFSKIDIKNAFHQVEISPESREITTFITSKGLYRYTRLMFGINCAPEIFQRIMEQILAGLRGWLCFLDDILVHGETREEHDRNRGPG